MTDDGTLQLFNFEEHEFRTFVIDGEPWCVANDACEVLGIGNAREAVARLDPDDVSQADVIDSLGRSQQTNIVNESGLYELILRSEKPMARKFRRWVTSVVLPSLRRGDIYSSTDLLVAAAVRLRDIEAEHRRLDAEARQHRKVITEHSARLDSIEHNTGWMTALAYAKNKKAARTDDATMAKLGKMAAYVTRADYRQEPGKTRDQRFGTVGVYPEGALDKAWDVLGLAAEHGQ